MDKETLNLIILAIGLVVVLFAVLFFVIKKYRTKQNNNPIFDSQVIADSEPNVKHEPVKIETNAVNGAQKNTFLFFDPVRRVFVTKQKTTCVGLYSPSNKTFYIRLPNGTIKDYVFNPLNDDELAYPLVGDWQGKGYDGIGLYYPQKKLALFKQEMDGQKGFDSSITYQLDYEHQPLVGNWHGSGIDTLGFYAVKESAFVLFNEKKPSVFHFGNKNYGYLPIVGDWDGRGQDSIGLYDPKTSLFRLKKQLEGNKADYIFKFGPNNNQESLLPITGKWLDTDSIGLYEKNTGVFKLKNKPTPGTSDSIYKMYDNMIPISISGS